MKKLIQIIYHKIYILGCNSTNRILNRLDRKYANIKMQDEYDSRQVISRLKGCKKTISNMIKLLEEHVQDIEKD